MARRIKTPITLRITEAELVDSQLEAGDTSAATKSFDRAADGDGDGGGTVECQGPYCEKGYKSKPIELELA
jgi:hypothetical protein